MTSRSMEDLQCNPLWREDDLGKPLPDSVHAVSVSMPLWRHVIGYEEGDADVLAALRCGYPRFFCHPLIQRLFQQASGRFAEDGETTFVFSSRGAAARCVSYLQNTRNCPARTDSFGMNGLHCVTFSEANKESATAFRQHFGDVVSSRCALSVLEGSMVDGDRDAAKTLIRARIAGFTGASAENVFLYPTGMAAARGALALAQGCRPGAKSIQLGFPYVDVLKIQTVEGPGNHFFPKGEPSDLDAIEAIVSQETISCVMTEFPGNALLRSVDILKLSRILRQYDVPLIVDDTVSTFVNTRLLPHADILLSSLTKSFSGVGDVMGGSLVFNSASPNFTRFSAEHESRFEDCLWVEDAQVLEINSRDAAERIQRMSETAEALCAFLVDHPKVKHLYYPKYETSENYRALMREGGGFGGLFSVVLEDAARTAPLFYDALRVCKGPSLGNNFTLACPYTLLAHYKELDWVSSIGISPYLVRVSVGLEDKDALIARFEEVLAAL